MKKMNNTISAVLCTLFLAVCLSCGGSEANTSGTSATEKTEAATKQEKKQQNKATKAAKTPVNKATTSPYWDALQKSVGIGNEQLEAIKSLNEETSEKIRALRKDKVTLPLEDMKKLRLAERDQIQKILGDKLYQIKVEFDKDWTSSNTKDFPKMGG